ncbi:MAG: MFS transporter [Thaumarchaeota archaeon]|nr:MFS transporter [Nitrososphaerota archaeon]
MRADHGIYLISATIWSANGIIGLAVPLFLREKGAGPVEIGLAVALFTVTSALSAVPFGSLSDRLGRLPLLAIGISSLIISSLLLSAANDTIQVFLLMILQGLGIGAFDPSSNAALGDVARRNELGKAYGTLGFTSLSGSATGPAVGGVLISLFGFSNTFVFAALPMILVLLISLRSVRGLKGRGERKKTLNIKVSDFSRLLVIGWLGIGISFLAWGGLRAFFPVYAAEVGIDVVFIGLLFSSMIVVGGFARIPLGYLIDRYKKSHRFIALGLFTAGIVVAPIGSLTNPFLLLLLLGSTGISRGTANLASNVLIASESSTESKGMMMGITSMSRNIGSTLGPALGGVIISVAGFSTGFLFLGLGEILGAVTILLLAHRHVEEK